MPISRSREADRYCSVPVAIEHGRRIKVIAIVFRVHAVRHCAVEFLLLQIYRWRVSDADAEIFGYLTRQTVLVAATYVVVEAHGE
jgi:hypothetical protein